MVEHYVLLNIAVKLKFVSSVIYWNLDINPSSFNITCCNFRNYILSCDKGYKEGPSLTCFLFVSPAVGLQIFWMGVSVASAPPQTLPPRWKGCRPPPVTRPSRRFRTSPLSDRHGHHRRTGPLLRPFSTHFTFVPNSFPKWLSFFSWIVLLHFKARREFSLWDRPKGMERLWMFFASAAINRCKTWCIYLYPSEERQFFFFGFPNGAIIFLITLRKENRCKQENNFDLQSQLANRYCVRI